MPMLAPICNPHRIERERLLDSGQQPSGDGGGVVGITVQQRQREFVASQPDDQVGAAQRVLEASAQLPEQLIAGGMAKGVVDLLEAVEVDEHEGQAPLGSVGVPLLGQDGVEQLEQRAAVAQAGQLVGDRLLPALVGERAQPEQRES